MPRPVRKDLSYFTLDCDIFSKKADLRPLLRKFKADGLAVYIHILCDVYGTGYYFKPDDYEGYLLDIAEDCGISVEKVQLILTFMADRTLLDAISLNKNTVFTSHGIQKRYAEAMKGRKRSIAEIKGEHWLLTEEEESGIETFYKSRNSADKSEKIDDKSEKIDDKSEIYNTTEQNRNKKNGTESNSSCLEKEEIITNNSASACARNKEGFIRNADRGNPNVENLRGFALLLHKTDNYVDITLNALDELCVNVDNLSAHILGEIAARVYKYNPTSPKAYIKAILETEGIIKK